MFLKSNCLPCCSRHVSQIKLSPLLFPTCFSNQIISPALPHMFPKSNYLRCYSPHVSQIKWSPMLFPIKCFLCELKTSHSIWNYLKKVVSGIILWYCMIKCMDIVVYDLYTCIHSYSSLHKAVIYVSAATGVFLWERWLHDKSPVIMVMSNFTTCTCTEMNIDHQSDRVFLVSACFTWG